MTALDTLRRGLDKPTVDQIAEAAQADISAVCDEFTHRSDPLGMFDSFPRMAMMIAVRAHKRPLERAALEAMHKLFEASSAGSRYDDDVTYNNAIEDFQAAAEALIDWAYKDAAKD